MVKRRELLLALIPTQASLVPTARGQTSRRLFRIGVIETLPASMNEANMEGFSRGMAERGLIEGRDYVIDYQVGSGSLDRFKELAGDLVQSGVDLIITRGTPAAIAAKNSTTSIPIVMAAVGDPKTVVASINRPGGNITGFTSLTSELVAKRISVMRDILPQARIFGSLSNLGNASLVEEFEVLRRVAAASDIHVSMFDVRRREDLAPAFTEMKQNGIEAISVSTDAVTQANRVLIAELATRHRLPTMCVSKEFVDAGGLLTYGVHYPDLYRRAGVYAVRILRGAKPGDLPIEQPTRFELVINSRTAASLGVDIPPSVLALADEVIE